MSPEKAKARPLVALLEFIESDIERAKQHAKNGESDLAEDVGVGALECLASIGKGMQVPDDVPINIYDDDEANSTARNSYWESDEGQAIQQRIVGCFSVLEVVGGYSAAIDAVCQVSYSTGKMPFTATYIRAELMKDC